MNKHILAVAIVAIALLQLYSPIASAQFSVQGGIGYNLGIPGDLIGQNGTNGTMTAVYGSYGSGLNFNAQVTDNLSCCPAMEWGIGADLQLGTKHSFTQGTSDGGFTSSIVTTGKINMFSFAPRIGMHINCGPKFTPYTYYGPVIGIPLSYNQTQTETSSSGGTSDVVAENAKTTGKLSVGITGAIGVRVPLAKKIGAYFEAGYNYMNFYPNIKTITAFTVNGVSELNSFTKSQIETDYVKSISSTDNSSSDQPFKAIRDPVPYSGFRINAGLRYAF